MLIVKADTATTVPVGPFVDVTDGYTMETGVDISAADSAAILKNGASSVVDVSSNTFTAITGMDGMYNLSLTASNLDTEGRLVVVIEDVSLCRPVKQEIMVVNANVWDSLYAEAGTDYLQVDALQFNGNATSGLLTGATALKADMTLISGSSGAADNLEAGALGVVTGAVSGSTSTTTSIVTDLTETTNDHYNGRTIVFTSGELLGAAASITDYNGSAATLTVSALVLAPTAADTFVIV